MKLKNLIQTSWLLLTLSLVGCAWPVKAADITPGYVFSPGEQNITDVKLNTATAGSVNTSLFTSKSAKTTLDSVDLFLVYDPSAGAFRKVTFSNLIATKLDKASGLATNLGVTNLTATNVVVAYKLVLQFPNNVTVGMSAANAVPLTNIVIRIQANSGTITKTRVPTLDAGVNGQVVYILGNDQFEAPTNGTVFQDDATLSGSTLHLGATTRKVGRGDILCLMYCDDLGGGGAGWIELFYSDNL